MTQLSLFDTKPRPTNQYGYQIEPQSAEVSSKARRTDPETSHKAAAAVSCGLSDVELLAVKVMRQWCVEMTANEIAAKAYPLTDTEQVGAVLAKRETMRKRVGELTRPAFFKDGTQRRDQWFRVTGSRECQVTGKEATTFEVIP